MDKEAINKYISNSYLTRTHAVTDAYNRYIEIRLRRKVNWLKIHLLIILLNHDDLMLTQLARMMVRSSYSMTKLVNDLARDNYIRRFRKSNDRRAIYVQLKPDGLKYISDYIKDIIEVDKEINSCLTKSELETFTFLGKKLKYKLIEILGYDA